MKIVYINGIARAGKDTFVEYCSKYADVYLTSTVDEVKKICLSTFGWDGVKDEKGRALLSNIRAAWTAYNLGPVHCIKKVIDTAQSHNADMVFIMVREHPEMMRMQQMFGGETLCVLPRAGLLICETEQNFLDMVPNHYQYEHYIDNTKSLEELDKIAQKFCFRIKHSHNHEGKYGTIWR